MNKWLFAFVAGVPLAIAGCGGNLGEMAEGKGESPMENEALAVAVVGGASTMEGSGEVTGQAQSDMNAKILESVASKVEELLNAEMENEEFRDEILQAEAQASVSKDVKVSLGFKGLRVDIIDEIIPFAGGTMTLNGDVALKLRYTGGGTIALEADGELLSDLDGVERAGVIRDIPYYLSLQGSNVMGMDGAFKVTISKWKVSNLSADFTISIINSDVTAKGIIDDKSVVGSVNFVDMSIGLTNANLLKNPQDFNVECTGTIETLINEDPVVSCTIDPSCKGCE
jgi:hypothetical protein